QEDHLGIRDRALIGVDALMWGNDYPHTESTFPRSRTILERILDGVDEAERRKITSENVARLYHFDLEGASGTSPTSLERNPKRHPIGGRRRCHSVAHS